VVKGATSKMKYNDVYYFKSGVYRMVFLARIFTHLLQNQDYPINWQRHGSESFLISHQLLSYSRISQHFGQSEGSLPCSQEPATGPYPRPDFSRSSHLISLRSLLILLSHHQDFSVTKEKSHFPYALCYLMSPDSEYSYGYYINIYFAKYSTLSWK
jgi:hypothetical protein